MGSLHTGTVHIHVCFIRVSVLGLLIVCAPGVLRAGTLLGGLTRDGLLAIIGVTLSNSAIPHCRADNRLCAGDCEKSMDSPYPWLASAVVSFLVSLRFRHW
ncbi:hypothetical protein ACQKWADRAFT_162896 [Trichoderma austrokoningii]